MSHSPYITVPVDPNNPGQFFACCGLLEIADRRWPCAEAWFEGREFHIRCVGNLRTLLEVLICDPPQQQLFVCETLPIKPIVAPLALTFEGHDLNRFVLDFWTKIITKAGTVQAVAAPPWNLWSGNQKSLPIWLQLRDALRILIAGDEVSESKIATDDQLLNLFRLTRPLTGRFGFDSTAAWNPQDVGFSPNDQGIAVESSPATELLAAVGLQRFRPAINGRVIQYQHWNIPAPPAIAAALTCGGIRHDGNRYQFQIVDRGQYSAFGKSHLMKGEFANV